jgi:hypothetical protein
MKTFVSSIITIAVFVSLGGTVTSGQEPPPALAVVEENLARIEAEALPAVEAALALEHGNRDQAEHAERQVRQVLELAQAATAAVSPPPAGASASYATRLQRIVSRGASKAMIIRSSQMEPKNLANLEEDLSVMGRILDKALAQKLDDDDHRPRSAMGIDVFLTPGSSPVRSLYLEDYGVVFTLNVNFPLLAPPTRPAEEKEKTEADSTWEETKREVFGQRRVWSDSDQFFRFHSGRDGGQEYNEKKVEDLKESLLEALKNATNIRTLKPDDVITVCVFGGSSALSAKAKAVVRRGPEPRPGSRTDSDDSQEAPVIWAEQDNAGPARGTTMTIRVRKSDVDAFAKGKLSPADFRKKAAITAYPGDGGGWGTGATFGFGMP